MQSGSWRPYLNCWGLIEKENSETVYACCCNIVVRFVNSMGASLLYAINLWRWVHNATKVVEIKAGLSLSRPEGINFTIQAGSHHPVGEIRCTKCSGCGSSPSLVTLGISRRRLPSILDKVAERDAEVRDRYCSH
jgi:hypothetical protein